MAPINCMLLLLLLLLLLARVAAAAAAAGPHQSYNEARHSPREDS
jgi:hypothetical protein